MRMGKTIHVIEYMLKQASQVVGFHLNSLRCIILNAVERFESRGDNDEKKSRIDDIYSTLLGSFV